MGNLSDESYANGMEHAPTILNQVSDAVITLDEKRRIVFWNESARNIFGYGADEVLGKPLTFIIPSRFQQKFLEDIATAYTNEVIQDLAASEPLMGVTKEAMEFPMEIRLVPWKSEKKRLVTAVIHASAERHQAAEFLRASEERYSSLFENASDMVYTHDVKGNFTSINRAGTELLGYRLDEALGLNFFDLLSAEHQQVARQMMTREMSGVRTGVFDVELNSRSGHKTPVEISIQLIVQGGRILGIQGIARDVSERRLLEDQLVRTQKMQAIERFARGVAHDFNNQLNIILGYSELLLMETNAPETVGKKIREIQKAGEKSASLTGQLMVLSQRQTVQPQLLDLNKMVVELEEMLRHLLGRGHHLEIQTDPESGYVNVDRGHLTQAVLNLVENARDAIGNDGKITVETGLTFLDEDYSRIHGDVVPGHYAMLSVADTGVGMDKETQQHIFEPFFTTKKDEKGVGLGLSTVYGIVKQSGGGIWVSSELGKGSTFRIYFPHVQETDKKKTDQIRPAAAATGHETVLVVEDIQGVRELTCEVLRMNGYEVLSAENGHEAIRVAKSRTGDIHLLVTDVGMPKMSGPELAERFARLRPAAKVLFMSGYTDAPGLETAVISEKGHFIQKPFSMATLVRKVREILDAQEYSIPP